MAIIRAEIVAFEKSAFATGIVIPDRAQPRPAGFIEVKVGDSQDPLAKGPTVVTDALGPKQPGAVV